MRFLFSFFLLLLCAFPAQAGLFNSDAKLLDKAMIKFDPIPPNPPELPENELTDEKVALGKMLFFDPRLSRSQLVSCNTCHNLALGGVDHQETSRGHAWQTGSRNAPTVLNSIFNIAYFWDGRARDLEEQAAGPLVSPFEMASSDPYICKVLSSIPTYVEKFHEAFPDRDEPICFANARKALEAFEVTLLTPDAPFDRFLRGDLNAIGKVEKKGLRLFIDKGCADCHMSMNIGGNSYYVFGVKKKPAAKYLPAQDLGRRAILDTIKADYVFKAPSLRNISLTSPYFHSGKVWSLDEAVKVMAESQLGITLKKKEINSLIAFLKTLTGRQPQLEYPILPMATGDTPRPVPQ